RGEVLGVREQHGPLAVDVIVEADVTFGGLRLEIGGGIADENCHGKSPISRVGPLVGRHYRTGTAPMRRCGMKSFCVLPSRRNTPCLRRPGVAQKLRYPLRGWRAGWPCRRRARRPSAREPGPARWAG